MRCFPLAAFLLVVAMLAGCSAGATQVDRIAPSTTLANTAPDQLDLTVHLTLGDPTMPQQARLTIIVSHQNKLVQFTRAEEMTCNGTVLTRFLGAFEEAVSAVDLAGHPLRCTYTSGQATAPLTMLVPTLPVILAPHNGATVPRSGQTQIRYAALPHPFHLIAFGRASKAFPNAADQGPVQTLLDTRPLAAGQGTITLTEEVAPMLLQGDAFHALSGDAEASATIAVTWI